MNSRNVRWIAGLSAIAVVGLIAAAGLIGGAAVVAADEGSFGCPYDSATGRSHWSGGMMGGSFGGMMGRGFGSVTDADPLNLEVAESAVEDYLADRGDPDLEIAEIMIFSNHAYAEVVEVSTGIGAFEVLVDPITLAVYPEPGPNMMWNLKYGHMGTAGGTGMMSGWRWSRGSTRRGRGMMPWSQQKADPLAAEMPMSAAEAVDIAQRYLDAYLPGAQAAEEADPFYGYYTIHVLQDDHVTGMLSVNGYTEQVFVHTWHGDFVTMSEDHEG
jgi:hypothetical protein